MTEFRPTRFEILPPVIKNLLIISGLAFLAQNTIGNSASFNMDNLFALHNWQSPLFKPWQIITHLFMHGDFMHLLGNMFALWMFGSILENLWGPKRFLLFYFVCGLGAALLHMVFLSWEINGIQSDLQQLEVAFTPEKFAAFLDKHSLNSDAGMVDKQQALYAIRQYISTKLDVSTVGASGAVFGVLAAFVYLFPNTYIYLYFFVPVKAKWLGLAYFAYELLFAIRNSAGDNVARWAHIGGAIVGLILVILWKRDRHKFY